MTKRPSGESSIVDFPHFVRDLLDEFCDPVTEDELDKAFKVLDTDNDGLISADNVGNILREFGKQLTDEELHSIFSEFSPSQDSRHLLSFQQFMSMINEAEYS
ncbi:uncharacterized protein LOC134841855 [Symsagittifera roscoffensis]|uniref:uncharacterized protein LOC134841855 n=1 Tax=Symsagittifera roscoffensis TaxID=84072 RepID=UPI00307BBAF4